MESRRTPRLRVLLILCSVFSQTVAWPPFGAPAALGILYERASEPDQASLKRDTDILQDALAENDAPYYDVSRNSRHADAIFTSEYGRLLSQIAARKYLQSLVGKEDGNGVLEGQGPNKRHSDAVFTDNYTRLRKQMAVRKYLNSILNGKRSNEGESADFLEDLEK